jgi:hypothetical protein
MFEDADEDGDGLLDLNEYTRIHLQLKHIPGLEFEDENGDGQLDLKEFAQTLANLNIPNSPDPRASTEKDSTTIDEEEEPVYGTVAKKRPAKLKDTALFDAVSVPIDSYSCLTATLQL